MPGEEAAAGGSGGSGGMAAAASGGASLLGSIIGGLFAMHEGKENRAQQERLHGEEMAMANKQFDWGQTIDRFNMKMTLKEALAKANETQRATIMDALKNKLALQDRAGNLFGSRG